MSNDTIRYLEEQELLDAPDGMYVCYVDFPYTNLFADRKLLMKDGHEFYLRGSDARHRGPIYGAYGPLPAMRLQDETTGDL